MRKFASIKMVPSRVGFAVLLMSSALSSHAVDLSLRQAVLTGILNHPEVQAARAEIRSADADISVAKSGYAPSVSIAGGPRRVGLSDWTYEVTATQVVYDWGNIASKVDYAKAVQQQLSESFLVTRDAAALDIAEMYLDAWLASKRLTVTALHVDTLKRIRTMTLDRSHGGYADRAEPDRAALELLRAEEQYLVEQGRLTQALQQLRVLVGANPYKLTDPVLPEHVVNFESGELPLMIRQSPLFKKTLQDTNQAKASLKSARATLLPQLNIEASALRRTVFGRTEDDSMIALRLRFTPFQGNANTQRVESARRQVESAEWKEGATERDMLRELQGMRTMIEVLADREIVMRKQVHDAAALAGVYEEQFQAGRRDIIDLLNVQRERFETERQRHDYRAEQTRIQFRIAARLGLVGALLNEELPQP